MLYGLNAGKTLDISQKPQKADVITVLGGDWSGYRIRKALVLYKTGFSKNKRILVNACQEIELHEGKRVYRTETSYLTAHGVSKSNIDTPILCGNTMTEIERIKRYMQNHRYRSVIIITDPPHTRRVKMLAKIAGYEEKGFKTILVSADVPWWNRERYYTNFQSLRYVLFETLKIPSNYLAYGVIEKMGLMPFVRKYVRDIVLPLKETITNFLNAL